MLFVRLSWFLIVGIREWLRNLGVSRRDTNADRIIEALDKHTGENCHDVIARPGGVSGFHLTRVMKS